MGALLSRFQSLAIQNESLDETVDVDAKINHAFTPTHQGCHKRIILDPRSPSEGVTRTPIHPDNNDKKNANPEPAPQFLIDPRSPNCDVNRTPIVADCDVHQTWEFDSTNNETADSLYVNSPSVGVCDLSFNSFECGPSVPLKSGSLENLLESDDTDEGVHIYENDPEPTISPIGSPIKATDNADVQALTKSRSSSSDASPRASTPNKPSARKPKALTLRDSNSPLSIIQRKQSAKINDNLVGGPNNRLAHYGKENVIN